MIFQIIELMWFQLYTYHKETTQIRKICLEKKHCEYTLICTHMMVSIDL